MSSRSLPGAEAYPLDKKGSERMNIVFLGCTAYSEVLLKYLLENKLEVKAIFSIPRFFHISYSKTPVKNSNFADLSIIAENHSIPLYWVDSVKGKRLNDYYDILNDIHPDLILVLGWYYMIPEKIRSLARLGAWGIHSSLLPEYAGGAPLVWAIISGEKETGVTLFRMDDGVDSGEIIRQKRFDIDFQDTIKEVYEKATEASKEILFETLTHIDSVNFIPQDKSRIKIYPQRKPEDGEIDWNKPANELYNFIRSQCTPYPGAFVKTIDNKKLIIEKARIEEL
jgi:methionyl-tRNA formyltransferase